MSTFHETAQRTAGHIRQPFILQEIADQIETGEYNAELMLQHLLLCADSLERENAAFKAENAALRVELQEQCALNAALREDKERLDELLEHGVVGWYAEPLKWIGDQKITRCYTREDIDDARPS